MARLQCMGGLQCMGMEMELAFFSANVIIVLKSIGQNLMLVLMGCKKYVSISYTMK